MTSFDRASEIFLMGSKWQAWYVMLRAVIPGEEDDSVVYDLARTYSTDVSAWRSSGVR